MLTQHSHPFPRLIVKVILAVVISAISTLAVTTPSYAANPGDSKKECEKIGGYYETYKGKSTCNANVDQKKCATYGGTYQIQYSGSKLACIIPKDAKPQTDGNGTTCGEYGCADLDPNAPVSSSTNDPTQCQTSIIKINCDANGSGIWNLLLLVITILTAGVGLVAIGGFVYAAILYTTAEGDAGKVTKAKTTIFNVVLGLVVFALMYAFIQFLIPGGVFDRNYTLPEAPASTTTSGGAGNNSASSTGGTGSSGNSTPSTGSSISSITSVKNIRDASGSGALKSGVLYRSGAINGISAKDKATLASTIGGGTIINLSQPNDIPINGVTDKHFALMGITNTKPLVTNAAQRTGVGNALKAAANASGPVLIHCTHGKDRTGWLVAMIMYASGANDAQVMAEYLKSNQAIPGGVQASWLSDGVQAARKQYGSVIKYLKNGCGLSDADIKKLKNKFGA